MLKIRPKTAGGYLSKFGTSSRRPSALAFQGLRGFLPLHFLSMLKLELLEDQNRSHQHQQPISNGQVSATKTTYDQITLQVSFKNAHLSVNQF
jgi:hypothetical protein